MHILLTIKVIPKSGKQTLTLDKNCMLKLYLKNPPEDGKANKELIAFLAKALRIPQSAITIVKGLTSRAKTIAITTNSSIEKLYQQLGFDYQQNV